MGNKDSILSRFHREKEFVWLFWDCLAFTCLFLKFPFRHTKNQVILKKNLIRQQVAKTQVVRSTVRTLLCYFLQIADSSNSWNVNVLICIFQWRILRPLFWMTLNELNGVTSYNCRVGFHIIMQISRASI